MISPFYKHGYPICHPDDFKAGDIIGFSGDAWGSSFINIMTYGLPLWSLSHCGIVGEHEGQLLLFEAMTNSNLPCEIQGGLFQGSQAHGIIEAVTQYQGKAWHYPLYRRLFQHERERLSEFLYETIGVPYDRIGAFRAGGIGFSWLESQLQTRDMSSLFCSEWCATAHGEIGIFPNDNGARWNPNYFVRTERKMGLLQRPRRLK